MWLCKYMVSAYFKLFLYLRPCSLLHFIALLYLLAIPFASSSISLFVYIVSFVHTIQALEYSEMLLQLNQTVE